MTNPLTPAYNVIVGWVRRLEDRLTLKAEWPPTVLLNDLPETLDDYTREVRGDDARVQAGTAWRREGSSAKDASADVLGEDRSPRVEKQDDQDEKEHDSRG